MKVDLMQFFPQKEYLRNVTYETCKTQDLRMTVILLRADPLSFLNLNTVSNQLNVAHPPLFIFVICAA